MYARLNFCKKNGVCFLDIVSWNKIFCKLSDFSQFVRSQFNPSFVDHSLWTLCESCAVVSSWQKMAWKSR